jgi:predicted amidohydrolase YtcJ
MRISIRSKRSRLAHAACILLTASITSIAHAQGDVEEAIGGLISPKTTTIYVAKRVITMDDKNPSATAVAVSDDRIVAVGSLDSLKKALEGTRYSVDTTFDQRYIMPGLIDQHLHPILGALTLSTPVIAPEAWVLPGKTWPAATTHEEYMAALRAVEKGMKDPKEPLFTWGYLQFFHGMVRRKDLDSISLTRPIMVWHRSAHEVILNTAALNKFGITRESVTGKGQPSEQTDWDNGYFYENGFFVLVAPKVLPILASPERITFGIQQMVEMLHNNGVTAYMEPGAVGTPALFAFYKKVLGASDVPMYSFFIADGKTGYEKGGGSAGAIQAAETAISSIPTTGKVRRLPGEIKLYADGAVISLLMQMIDGYTDGHQGQWLMNPDDFAKAFKTYWNAGYQIHIHTTGDEGLEMVLTTLEQNLKDNPRVDHRTVIVHFAASNEAQVARIAKAGALVSGNPYYVNGFADNFGVNGLGKERADAMVRLAPVEKAGISLSLHSDLPMGPSQPLYLAWCAVNRVTKSGRSARPDLGISVDQALHAITINSAYSWQMEKELGSIEPHKIANFTVLDEDPYAVPPMHLKDIRIWGTVFEGTKFPILPKPANP